MHLLTPYDESSTSSLLKLFLFCDFLVVYEHQNNKKEFTRFSTWWLLQRWFPNMIIHVHRPMHKLTSWLVGRWTRTDAGAGGLHPQVQRSAAS